MTEITAAARRPRDVDPAVQEEAVLSFSKSLASSGIEDVGNDAAEIAADLRRLGAIGSVSGGELAERLYNWSLADADMDAVEALDAWSSHLSDALRAHQRAWVRAGCATCPLDGLARIVQCWRGEGRAGVVYQEPRAAETGYCLFVPDDEHGRFVSDGAYTGGWMIAWEDLGPLSESTEADRALLAGRRRREAESEARKAVPHVSTKVDDGVARAMRGLSASSPDALRADATDLLARVGGLGEEFDVLHPDVGALLASLLLLRRSASAR